MATDKPEDKRSKKWIAMWIVQTALTIFTIVGLVYYTSSADDWVSIMQVWVNFTLINVIGYHGANVVRHGQYKGWNGGKNKKDNK